MSELPPPIIPAGVDLRDFPRMMIDIGRLRGSEFDAIADDAAWRAGVNLWLSSWHQVPAGSLRGSDDQLAKLAGLGRDLRSWRKVKAAALHGWQLCSDGRWYHRVVCEVALEAWLSKLAQRLKSGKGNSRRWGGAFDASAVEAEREVATSCLAALRAKEAWSVASPRDAPGMPQRSQVKGREDTDPPDQAASAAADPGQEAWTRGAALLQARGRMASGRARTFIGRLLKDNPGLEARDLLPSIVKAEASGTADPQSYLSAAARAIIGRRPGAQSPNVSTWPDEVWDSALAAFRDNPDRWSAAMGPKPGEAGCLAPSAVLAVHGFGAKVISLRTGGAA